MDVVRTLLELQDRDLRIVRLNKQLDEMPEKRAILAARQKEAEIASLLERARAAVRVMDAHVRKSEDERSVIAAKIEREQAKLLSGEVKNPKELAAISMELDALKRRQDALEDEQLTRMQKRESAGEQQARIEAALEAAKAKEGQLIQAFRGRGGDILTQTEQLNAERERLAGALEPELRARYEAVRRSKHGIAVGVLEGDSCGACRVSIPAGKLEVLLEGPDVAQCPMCQRMLVVRGHE